MIKTKEELTTLTQECKKFLISMQKLQRAVSKKDTQNIQKLKTDFEGNKRILEEIIKKRKRTEQHTHPGQIISKSDKLHLSPSKMSLSQSREKNTSPHHSKVYLARITPSPKNIVSEQHKSAQAILQGQVEKLQKALKTSQNQCRQLDGDKNRFKSLFEAKNDEIRNLVANHNKTLKMFSLQNQEREAKDSATQNRLGEIKKELDKKRILWKKAEHQLKSQQERIAAYQNQVLQKEKENKTFKNSHKNLEKQILFADSKTQGLENQVQELISANSHFEKRVAQLEEK